MACPLCSKDNDHIILEKQGTNVWTNAPDTEAGWWVHPCLLNQCLACGHVFQPGDERLAKMLDKLYTSDRAQVSTPMGLGNWGKERFECSLKSFSRAVDLNQFASVLEIGGGNGHLLYHLRSLGCRRLMNLEPSLKKTEDRDGISFVKGLAGNELDLGEKFDLIYSIGVFEHIEMIGEVIGFCRRHLNKNGVLYFQVPDAKSDLETGNPALFLHQHLHYFTEESVRLLLAGCNLQVNFLDFFDGAICVSAVRGDHPPKMAPQGDYSDFQFKLDQILSRVCRIASHSNVLVHGACNAMNNISSWAGKDLAYTLVDNDTTKQGKTFFNHVVRRTRDIALSEHDQVLILPIPFFEAIKNEYVSRGFNGSIDTVFTL